MPVALERKLKKQVAGKKMSKDRKDAYVYGTLRKTGWKPEREKKMETLNPSMIRLEKIDKDLESIIRFDDDKDRFLPSVGTGLTGAGLVGGGLYAAGAMAPKTYGGVGLGARSTIAKAGRDVSQIGKGGGTRILKTIGKGASSAGSGISALLAKLGLTAAKAMESKDKPIEFDASILGPWQGSKGHESKIDQLEFPAGMSPAAALKLPFPQLMALLNQRNILQQQFSRKERIVQLSAKLDEINATARPTK